MILDGYRLSLSAFNVILVQYEVMLVQYLVVFVQYPVILVQYQVKLFRLTGSCRRHFLALNKRKQVGVDHVLMRLRHTVWEPRVDLEYGILDDL